MNFVNWPEESESPLKFHVAPSSGAQKTINTLVVDKSKTYVFWSSPSLLTPVPAGWYLHAASVPGCLSSIDLEQDSSVRWEHVQVASQGLVPLQLVDGRTYAFYLTSASASEADLKKSHLPWTIFAHRVVSSPPIDYIIVPAQYFEVDDHAKEAAQHETFNANTYFYELQAFNSDEHLIEGNYLQKLVDTWATNGLIQGGALVDTSADDVDQWKFLMPYESNEATQLNPYGNVAALSRHHWHFVFPDPVKDSGGHVWTAASLKKAIKDGNAVAVTVGQLVMLSGDYFESFDEMKGVAKRKPTNIMQGFDEGDRYALMLLDVLSVPRGEKAQLDYMAAVADNKEKADKAQRNTKPQVQILVSLLRDASGPTLCSEIHTLARLWELKTGLKGREAKFRLDEMEGRLPWFHPDRGALASSLTPDEMHALDDPGFDETFFSMVISNGHYAALGLTNDKHFSPLNWQEFEADHKRALQLIDQHAQNPQAPRGLAHYNPIPAESIALTACGLHFLTDAFSSGHMRVPRSKLGPTGSFAAKVMHDIDGLYGLQVDNPYYNRPWRAFGDGFLQPEAIKLPTQNSMLKRLGLQNRAADNMGHCMGAVAAAFKQLHYQAQRAGSKKAAFKDVLHNTRGQNAAYLRWEDESSGFASDKKIVSEAIHQSIDERLAYLRNLTPRPAEVGKDDHHNHPPILSDDGEFNASAGAYEKFTTKFGYVHHIRLKWHGWSNIPENQPEYQVLYDPSKLYYAATYSKGAGSWAGGGEKKLLDILTKIPNAK